MLDLKLALIRTHNISFFFNPYRADKLFNTALMRG